MIKINGLRNAILKLCSLAFMAAVVFPNSAYAQENSLNVDTLTIAVSGSEPFVFEANDSSNHSGIAIDIWENIALEKGWAYEYKRFDKVKEALDAVQGKTVDILIGSISITSNRLTNVNFSQAYYQSSLSILSRADAPSLWDRIKPLLSFKLLFAIGGFLIILAIVGTLLWLAERKKSPEQFPSHPIKGIGNGMWLAIVTMSTTGYGDMAPITTKGRIIAGSWMIISIIFATSMVAGIASTLTLSGLGSSTITNVEQLSGKKVATVSASPAVGFLKDSKAKVVEANTIEDAINQLKDKKVQAVVYDRPQLLYYLNNNKEESLYLAKSEYYKQGYGFAFSMNNPLVNEVNRTLLKLAEDYTVKEIIDDYLGKED